MTLIELGLQTFRREWQPIALQRLCDVDLGRAKFVADKIKATRDYEHEHEHEHDGALGDGCGRNHERAFHPAGDADNEKKTARPNRAVNAALCAEHVKKKEQRRQKQKAHHFLHPHHPRTGPG